MARSTVFWSPSEASLSRASLNSIVAQEKLDVIEAMMKASTIGRRAEMGEGWIPGGLVSRQTAALLADRSPGSGSGNQDLVKFKAAFEASAKRQQAQNAEMGCIRPGSAPQGMRRRQRSSSSSATDLHRNANWAAMLHPRTSSKTTP
eukprot:TRINITY_DN15158_c0_g1_i1.p1 TRINITY_DN15158_c0_g1~~TRINITY_DN15158_c0_g1_i1.p1  ORF type:complete len:147 (+),score=29.80 TRINITY_DN15158_c0_g1_i1:84-524(+)